jgi:ADP-L-glycero-D-manno-heptose 6-epimerase
MYIVTGGAGFIGSAFARKLNQEEISDILIVDELKSGESWKNLRKIRYKDYLDKDLFLQKIESGSSLGFTPKAIIHMGACSSTTETNADYMMENNYRYTKVLADYAVKNGIKFIYASSAATYGDGLQGYSDAENNLTELKPLNIYGYSKQLFDIYARDKGYFKQICGLRFFNVFGPNEYHKEDMKSVVLKSFYQIKEKGEVSLFRSHRSDYKDGEQKRDFVYVKDCCNIMWWLLNNNAGGLYNLGTGQARTWNDLVNSVYKAMDVKPNIRYIDMPDNLKKQYQYFTEADMSKLKNTKCPLNFLSLEESVKDYVQNYLLKDDNYL